MPKGYRLPRIDVSKRGLIPLTRPRKRSVDLSPMGRGGISLANRERD